MKNNLNKARQRKIKPNWIGDSIWDILCQQWASEEFQKKSTIAKINKVSGCGGFGGSRHTYGSISTSQHKYNMVICFSNYFLFITSQYIYIYIYIIWKVCEIYFIFLDKDEWNFSHYIRIVSSHAPTT